MKYCRKKSVSLFLVLAMTAGLFLCKPAEVKAAGNEWVQVGTQVDSAAENVAIGVSGGIPTVAYSAITATPSSGRRDIAKQYTGSGWGDLASSAFPADGTDYMLSPSIQYGTSGTPYLSYFDYIGQTAVVKEYIDGAWHDLPSFGYTNNDFNAMSAFKVYNGKPYIVYNTSSGKLTVERFDGTWNTNTHAFDGSWTLLLYTSTFGCNDFSIDVENDEPYVAVNDSISRGSVLRYHKDTATWEKLGGTDYDLHNSTYNSIQVINGVPYVAFYQVFKESNGPGQYYSSILIRKYESSSWSTVGRLFLPDTTGYITGLQLQFAGSVPYIGYYYVKGTNQNRTLKAYCLNGSDWRDLGLDGNLGTGSTYASEHGCFSFIVSGGVPYAAYTESQAGAFVPVVKKYLTLPGAPSHVTAAAGNGNATVSFTAPDFDGGSPITGYTVTATPQSGSPITATGTGSPITVTGLANGSAYTFTVTATTAQGTGAASPASGSVTPEAPPEPTSSSQESSSQQSSSSQTATSSQPSSPSNSSAAVSSSTSAKIQQNPKTGANTTALFELAVTTGLCLIAAVLMILVMRKKTTKK